MPNKWHSSYLCQQQEARPAQKRLVVWRMISFLLPWSSSLSWCSHSLVWEKLVWHMRIPYLLQASHIRQIYTNWLSIVIQRGGVGDYLRRKISLILHLLMYTLFIYFLRWLSYYSPHHHKAAAKCMHWFLRNITVMEKPKIFYAWQHYV